MRVPPATLYHYTSADGLNGIFGSHSVWASSISYLNDEDEFGYAFRRMTKLLKALVRMRPEFDHWLREVSDYGARSAGVHIGVFSLSEEADQLSQWRGYAPSGFTIGFSIHRLTELVEASGYTLVRCVYEIAEQRRLLKVLITDAVNQYDAATAGGTAPDVALNDYGYRLLVNTVRLAPILKNPAFAEEKEWRLISGVRRADSGEWQIRTKGSHFVPYLVFSLGDRGATPIADVVVGPSPSMALAHLAMPSLFHAYRIAATARRSQLPYRSHS